MMGDDHAQQARRQGIEAGTGLGKLAAVDPPVLEGQRSRCVDAEDCQLAVRKKGSRSGPTKRS